MRGQSAREYWRRKAHQYQQRWMLSARSAENARREAAHLRDRLEQVEHHVAALMEERSLLYDRIAGLAARELNK